MVAYRRWYVANKWWSHIIGGSVVVTSAMVDFTLMFCTIVIVIESVQVTIHQSRTNSVIHNDCNSSSVSYIVGRIVLTISGNLLFSFPQ